MRVFCTSNNGNFKDALLEKFCHMNVKLHFAMVSFWENLFFLLPWKLHVKMQSDCPTFVYFCNIIYFYSDKYSKNKRSFIQGGVHVFSKSDFLNVSTTE